MNKIEKKLVNTNRTKTIEKVETTQNNVVFHVLREK
jgi:hypothetical protein